MIRVGNIFKTQTVRLCSKTHVFTVSPYAIFQVKNLRHTWVPKKWRCQDENPLSSGSAHPSAPLPGLSWTGWLWPASLTSLRPTMELFTLSWSQATMLYPGRDQPQAPPRLWIG